MPPKGLVAKYYNNMEWRGTPVDERIEQDVTLRTFEQLIEQSHLSQSNISIAWNGWARIDDDGWYRFSTMSDDGSSIIVDDALVVDNGGLHASEKESEDIFLTKGMHHININYFNGPGSYQLVVAWQDRATKLPVDIAFFSQPLSKDLEILARHPVLSILAYMLVCSVFLLRFALNASYLPSLCLHSLWIAFVITLVIKNVLTMLPFSKTYHHSRGFSFDRKLTAFLSGSGTNAPNNDDQMIRYRSFFCFWRIGNTGGLNDLPDMLFYKTIQYLYSNKVLWLPQKTLFNDERLLHEGGIEAVKFFSSEMSLSASEAKLLNASLYHRFIYNPYMYSSVYKHQGIPAKAEECPTLDIKAQPLFLLLLQPDETSSFRNIVAVPFERYLYFIPEYALPVRLQGVPHE